MISTVVAALQTLPVQERAVVFLRDVLQWETRDIADLLRMHPDSGQPRVAASPPRARTYAAANPNRVPTTRAWT